MNEIDYLDAVGRVNKLYIDECITYKPTRKMNLWVKRIGVAAASFMLILGAALTVNHLNQPVVIDKNGFYIEDGVLLSYTGAETDVTIPEEVESIANFTFLENKNASKIEVIRLGASVQKVETNAFAGLENLDNIIIAANNLSFVVENGLIMTSDRSVLLHYEREGKTSFKIPDSVRFVEAHAVQSSELEDIDFGNIEYIGYNAFADNTFLKAIHLPDSVKYIDNGAFSGCSSAVDGTVPKGAEIGDEAFRRVPFYNSMLAGQMCPGEEIVRGLITPSEAILKTDMYSLTEQITYVLAAIRGDNDYKPGEAALLADAAVKGLPDVPEGLTVPESFTIEDLTFADCGWGNTGIYDLQIILPAGEYSIVMEAYGYRLVEELYWNESRFRLSNVYFVKNKAETDPTAVEGAFGWTATFDRNGAYYKGITLINEDGRIIHQDNESMDLPKLIFSPDGTRVAVEYHHIYDYCSFYVISLNGDNLMEPNYKCSEYLSKYYGNYMKGSLRFIDEDNIEGVNEHGTFRWNIYDSEVSYPYEDPILTSEKAHFYEMWFDGLLTADELLSKPAVMDDFMKSIQAATGYDLYHDEFTWKYVKEEDRYPFKFTITDETGIESRGIEANVIRSRYNGGPEEAVKYAVEVAPYCPTAFEDLLTMTVAVLRSSYGTLKFEYSEHGPGQPVYSIRHFPGALLVFHNWNMDDPLTEEMQPDEVIIPAETIHMFHGIGSKIENSSVYGNWSEVWYDVISGTANLKADFDGYSVLYVVSGEDLKLPSEESGWEEWKAEYGKKPIGTILQIRLERTK